MLTERANYRAFSAEATWAMAGVMLPRSLRHRLGQGIISDVSRLARALERRDDRR